ncbi:MAG: hypothetical protein ACRC11_20175, partial [Xenococcaceae cyanobacterium]
KMNCPALPNLVLADSSKGPSFWFESNAESSKTSLLPSALCPLPSALCLRAKRVTDTTNLMGYDGLLHLCHNKDCSRLTHPTLMHCFSC